MTRIILLLSVFLIFTNFNEKKLKVSSQKTIDKDLENLFSLMQGSFNSFNQAKNDSDYYNISLHMYPIWEEKGYFLYVEQALSSMPEKPYRQRIYELTRLTDSTFSSEIYNLEIDSLWIGKWKTPEAFDLISKENIESKAGCEVILKKNGKNHYKGSTGDKTCLSGFRGAIYASSEVEILKDKVISWDRGFDSLDVYVWGAEKGGYVFNKIK